MNMEDDFQMVGQMAENDTGPETYLVFSTVTMLGLVDRYVDQGDDTALEFWMEGWGENRIFCVTDKCATPEEAVQKTEAGTPFDRQYGRSGLHGRFWTMNVSDIANSTMEPAMCRDTLAHFSYKSIGQFHDFLETLLYGQQTVKAAQHNKGQIYGHSGG